jgi:hypothetical protein
MAVANTLAYYDTATIKAIEVFREQAPECIMLRLAIQNIALLNVIRQNVVCAKWHYPECRYVIMHSVTVAPVECYF